MPSTSRAGVDSALPNARLPVASSNTATSVNVPPMSTASLRLERPESIKGCELRLEARNQAHRVLAVDRREVARAESVTREPFHVVRRRAVGIVGSEHDLRYGDELEQRGQRHRVRRLGG